MTDRADGGRPAKRLDALAPERVQQGNERWWTENPMAYDWHGELRHERFSREWFDAIDARFIHGARLFATDRKPFDRILPLEGLAGKRVLEIGCGMGLHTETMIRAGAEVTAIDLSDTAIEATKRRLELKGLTAKVMKTDAEKLSFPQRSFDFVWSWGVIHHSARTAAIVRRIAEVLDPEGEARVMVYNRDGVSAWYTFFRHYLLGGGFSRHSFDEMLFKRSDGFSARFYPRDQFEDLFRAFFADVSSEICGQDADAVPLPRRIRAVVMPLVPGSFLRSRQAKRGSFIFLKARRPI
jgi:2-polyprenyl-3-methyl-5-hydroxy-6-metoxy-1,4-benzoquinol methylase